VQVLGKSGWEVRVLESSKSQKALVTFPRSHRKLVAVRSRTQNLLTPRTVFLHNDCTDCFSLKLR
jgi:hypothetical protein